MAIPTPTERRVVRLFLCHAESPLWAAGGPISYEDSHLSSQLIEDLRSWEASFYGGGARGSDVVASGQELGRRLASELGHRFVVSVDRMEGVPEMIRVKNCFGSRGGEGICREVRVGTSLT